MHITSHLTVMSSPGCFSILRTFAAILQQHLALTVGISLLSLVCLSLASTLSGIIPAQALCKVPTSGIPSTARTDHLFLGCFSYFDFCLWCCLLICGNLISLKNFRSFVGCLDQDLPFPHPSWFPQRTPRYLEGKNIMTFTDSIPCVTRANFTQLDIH